MMGKCKNSSINGLEEGDPVYKLKLTNLKIFYILPKISNKLEKQGSKFGTGGIMSKTLLALSMAMACAFSSGLVFTWTIADVILVIYNLYPLAVIPEIGMIAIVCCYILFFMTAYIQKKRT